MEYKITPEEAIENLIALKVNLRATGFDTNDSIDMAVESLKMQEPAEWLEANYTSYLNGGGSLLVKGYRCSNCRFFRRKRFGKSEFCENCGRRMIEKEAKE